MDGGVVGDPHRRTTVEQLADGRCCHHGDQPSGPAEEHYRGDAEDEGEGDARSVEALERDRKSVGEQHRSEQERETDEQLAGGV